MGKSGSEIGRMQTFEETLSIWARFIAAGLTGAGWLQFEKGI